MQVVDEMIRLKQYFDREAMPDDWIDPVAHFHVDILARGKCPEIFFELRKWLANDALPIGIRAVGVFILGSCSLEGKIELVEALPSLQGKAAELARYGLALKPISGPDALNALREFWMSVALDIYDIAPDYKSRYLCQEAGIAYKPGYAYSDRSVEEILLATGGFECYLDTIRERSLIQAHLSQARQDATKDAIGFTARFLPAGDDEVVAFAKEIFARGDLVDPGARCCLADMVSKGKEAEQNLAWMLATEGDVKVQTRILNGMAGVSTDARRMVERVSNYMESYNLDDESMTTCIYILGLIPDDAALFQLKKIYSTTASETLRVTILKNASGLGARSVAPQMDVMRMGLNDPSPYVRRWAAERLAQGKAPKLPKETLRQILLDHLTRESDPKIRDYIRLMLTALD